MIELIPKVTVSQLALIVLYSRIIRFQSRSLAIIYSEFSVLALYAVLLFIATCSPPPSDCPDSILLRFIFVLRCISLCPLFRIPPPLLLTLLRDYLSLLFSFDPACFVPLCCFFSAFSPPHFRHCLFYRVSLSLSLPFFLFPLVLRFINSNAFRPFLGFVRALFRPILLYPASFFRRFSPLLFFLSLSLLASAYCRTSLNFLCALLQLCFTLLCPPRYFNPFYIVFWYYLNTTHRNATHTRNFASFRSALLRFALATHLSFFLFLPLTHFSSVQFILFCFVSLRLFFAGCCSFLRVPPCFTLLRCFVPFSFSLSLCPYFPLFLRFALSRVNPRLWRNPSRIDGAM